MVTIETKLFKEYPDTRITFIDKQKNIEWPKWKKYSECSDEEIKQSNLREIFPEEIVLDFETKEGFEMIKNRLINDGYNFYIYNSGSRGIHVHIFFYNLAAYSLEARNAIRKQFIKRYGADETKSSEKTLVALFNKPHFKTMVNKIIAYDNMTKDSVNMIPRDIRIEAEQLLTNRNIVTTTDEQFKDYHLTDPFFKYISTNIIPDDTERNNVLFPNLAIALVKEGLTEEQIKEIMQPIIQKNFPGKIYAEFNGWVKKAFNREIDTYNAIQINAWSNKFISHPEFYDTSAIVLNNTQSIQKTEKQIYSHKELLNLNLPDVKWLIENWIPIGDICFIAGKAASFKSTIVTHMGFAIAENKLVFNKYKVTPGKVLYLNEENTMINMKTLINRCTKGLEIKNASENIFFATFQDYRLDKSQDIDSLIKFINDNGITLLIADSFRRIFSGDENDATKINALFNSLKLLRSKCPFLTVIILHHLRKENSGKAEGGDIRDMLRGSSDIVNSADSIIGIKRKTGKNTFLIEHIKNRAGEEIQGKIIQLDSGEKQDKCYFYETTLEVDKTKIQSAPEECAEKIIQILDNKNLVVFTVGEISAFEEMSNFSSAAIARALKQLLIEETLSSVGNGRWTKYHYNKITQSTL